MIKPVFSALRRIVKFFVFVIFPLCGAVLLCKIHADPYWPGKSPEWYRSRGLPLSPEAGGGKAVEEALKRPIPGQKPSPATPLSSPEPQQTALPAAQPFDIDAALEAFGSGQLDWTDADEQFKENAFRRMWEACPPQRPSEYLRPSDGEVTYGRAWADRLDRLSIEQLQQLSEGFRWILLAYRLEQELEEELRRILDAYESQQPSQ